MEFDQPRGSLQLHKSISQNHQDPLHHQQNECDIG